MAMWNDYDKLARRLDRIANAFERIADALEADRKDEPPMDCKGCKHWKGGCDIDFPICKRDPVEDEPIIYGNEHNCIMTMFGECSYNETGCGSCAVVEKVRNALDKYEPKDEPLKTTEYCNYCNHKGCENCIANSLDENCVPSNFEEAVKDKPQLKEDGELEILTQTIEFPDTHQRFIFTRSIRADGDCLIIGDWEYKGKEDEPQTERSE